MLAGFIGAKGDGDGGDNTQSCNQIVTINKPTPNFSTGRNSFKIFLHPHPYPDDF